MTINGILNVGDIFSIQFLNSVSKPIRGTLQEPLVLLPDKSIKLESLVRENESKFNQT